jgi:hypothetical protein
MWYKNRPVIKYGFWQQIQREVRLYDVLVPYAIQASVKPINDFFLVIQYKIAADEHHWSKHVHCH